MCVSVPCGLFNLFKILRHLGFRRAGDKIHVGKEDRTLRHGEEIESDPAACHPPKGARQDSDGQRDGNPACANPGTDHRAEDALAKTCKAGIQFLAKSLGPVAAHARKGASEVPRQHQEGFHQRRQNDTDHDDRDGAQDRADDAADQQQRHKRRNSGER